MLKKNVFQFFIIKVDGITGSVNWTLLRNTMGKHGRKLDNFWNLAVPIARLEKETQFFILAASIIGRI